MSSIKKNVFLGILLMSLSFFTFADSVDERLVGNWQGQRDLDGKCIFLAWEVSREADGRFEVTFFLDSERKKVLGSERGRWQTENGQMTLLTDGVPSADIYTYTFGENNSVVFANIKRDPSADCAADYVFTDHRIQ